MEKINIKSDNQQKYYRHAFALNLFLFIKETNKKNKCKKNEKSGLS